MRIDTSGTAGFGGGLQNGISAAVALQSQARLARAADVVRGGSALANLRPELGATRSGPIGGGGASIEALGRQLAELRTTIERGGGKGPGLGLDGGAIADLMRAVDGALGVERVDTGPFVLEDVDFVLANPEVTRAQVPNGEALDVEVAVTSPGERAGVFMEFGSDRIEGQRGSTFTLEVSGALGSQQLSFPSGATIATIADAINRFSEVTGVRAGPASFGSDVGVKITSFDVGDEAFIRVRILDDGGIRMGRGVGVISGEDGSMPGGPFTPFSFMEASGSEIGDRGRDIEATINGIDATVDRQRISVDTAQFAVSMELRRIDQSPGSPFGANFVGSGLAFRITADESARSAGGVSPLEAAIAEGDSWAAVREIDRLLDALGYDASRPGLAYDGRG